jgi:uncharacterized protein (TIGR00255 family)
MFGAVAAGKEKGGYDTIFEAAKVMSKVEPVSYKPIPENTAVYKQLFEEFKLLHDYFGRGGNDVMKRLKKMKLEARLKDLLEQQTIDENRLAMELAVFADRCSIDEELVRLTSHIGQMREALSMNQPVGRKLDFLIQEMNREINSIGSKANDLSITKNVVEIKSEIEKIREQVQNIE